MTRIYVYSNFDIWFKMVFYTCSCFVLYAIVYAIYEYIYINIEYYRKRFNNAIEKLQVLSKLNYILDKKFSNMEEKLYVIEHKIFLQGKKLNHFIQKANENEQFINKNDFKLD